MTKRLPFESQSLQFCDALRLADDGSLLDRSCYRWPPAYIANHFSPAFGALAQAHLTTARAGPLTPSMSFVCSIINISDTNGQDKRRMDPRLFITLGCCVPDGRQSTSRKWPPQSPLSRLVERFLQRFLHRRSLPATLVSCKPDIP
uniref:Uncharacterized protein n=1 Tax=Schistocephalus solidus TaxID=70667 RepID=A0A0V0J559_SCHSO